MNKLKLYFRGEIHGEYSIGSRPLTIGRGQECDIVVHDPEVAEHHMIVVAQHGTIVSYDLAHKIHRKIPKQHLPLNITFSLGRDYSLIRVHDLDTEKDRSKKDLPEVLQTNYRPPSGLSLVVGRGKESRKFTVDTKPLFIGSSSDNDIVISDSAVDSWHCRLEPSESGLLIRDLGSLNGTFVNGVRIITALLSDGVRLSIGHTDMRIVQTMDQQSSLFSGMVGQSTAMLDVFCEVEQFSKLSWPVLILGESGTGKEGIARALHELGPRRHRNLVALNAGGFPENLIESELFGHEKGAFTGATCTHKGVFEQADGGTLFLDEIGELPIGLQTRLLRVIETQNIQRIGAESEIRIDVRLVCATNRDVRSMVNNNIFRNDLFYRLTRLIIEIPSLRARPEDVPILSNHFLRQIGNDVGCRRLTKSAMSHLVAYSWPGNARELYNVLSYACAVTASPMIEVSDIEYALNRISGNRVLNSVTVKALQQAVREHNGNQAAAARALGIARSTLRDRLKSVSQQ